MKYIEFTFTTVPSNQTVNDVLTFVLGEVNFESFVECEQGLKAYIPQESVDEQAIREAVADFPMPDVAISYTSAEAEDKNWNEVWEKNYFQPIVIGNRCVVHSTFHRDVPKAEYDIVINPQMAFGTGYHETTSLIMERLLELDLTGRTVLDVGCGTSILSILASMRGARSCKAIDVDEWCIRNSLENIALNHIGNITVRQQDSSALDGEEQFDIVIANINRNILLRDMKNYVLCMRPGAALHMSGFYVDDIPAIRAEAERLGLQFVASREKHRWATVEVRR